ncbi:hypothetical protein [Rhodococcus rhodochrous]|uniref:Uncharacterized protein n=1 Tax=Rhodococcus rhodochrous TaxID=1829 RepID=A0AA47AEQ0_RHORH|nr:hypothetical protein [Rhodococcus rhodochrous]UZF48500.1 hypothetical protein KUM34_029450 [Rhodococcus rhodochrous]
MDEHQQMQPPADHSCLDTVFASPRACRQLIERLARTKERDLRVHWSPCPGQESPPYGYEVKRQVPAEVQLLKAETQLDTQRVIFNRLWRELYDLLGVREMETSNYELILYVRGTLDRLNSRIAELEQAIVSETDPEA